MNGKILLEVVNTKMPFGKYKGTYIHRIPENYLVWFRQKGFPDGKIGVLLETMYEIRLNGLEELLTPIINKDYKKTI